MIGRAAVFDPGIFGRLKGFSVPAKEPILDELRSLSRKYCDNLSSEYGFDSFVDKKF